MSRNRVLNDSQEEAVVVGAERGMWMWEYLLTCDMRAINLDRCKMNLTTNDLPRA